MIPASQVRTLPPEPPSSQEKDTNMTNDRLTDFGKSLTPEQNRQYDIDYRAGYDDGRAGLSHGPDTNDAYNSGYVTGVSHRRQPHPDPIIYTGVIWPIEGNRFDGSYPHRWRDFYVDAGSVHVVVEARTGGERDRLLTMAGKTVTIKGGKALGKMTVKLACGEVETVRLA